MHHPRRISSSSSQVWAPPSITEAEGLWEAHRSNSSNSIFQPKHIKYQDEEVRLSKVKTLLHSFEMWTLCIEQEKGRAREFFFDGSGGFLTT